MARQAEPIRARLTIIDIQAEFHQKSPVLLGGVLSANEDELYVAIPGLFWPGTRFRVDYSSEDGPVSTFAMVQRIDPESPDGTERLGHALKVIADPKAAREQTKELLKVARGGK
jgi:hypothetical protein